MIMIAESQPLIYQLSEKHHLLVDRCLVELLLGEWLGGVTRLSFQLLIIVLTVPTSFVASAFVAAAFIAAAFIAAAFIAATFVKAC